MKHVLIAAAAMLAIGTTAVSAQYYGGGERREREERRESNERRERMERRREHCEHIGRQIRELRSERLNHEKRDVLIALTGEYERDCR